MSAVTGRARLSVAERRAQLLELGLELFSERSFDAVSIDDIAAAAGVSKGLLYHYFGSKRDFYVQIIAHVAAELKGRIDRAAELPLQPAEAIRAALRAYLDFVDRFGDHYSTLLRSGIGSDPEVLEIVESSRQYMVDRLLAGVGLKEAPHPLFRAVLRGWIGMVEGASLDWLDNGKDHQRESLVEVLATALRETVATAARVAPEAGVELD